MSASSKRWPARSRAGILAFLWALAAPPAVAGAAGAQFSFGAMAVGACAAGQFAAEGYGQSNFGGPGLVWELPPELAHYADPFADAAGVPVVRFAGWVKSGAGDPVVMDLGLLGPMPNGHFGAWVPFAHRAVEMRPGLAYRLDVFWYAHAGTNTSDWCPGCWLYNDATAFVDAARASAGFPTIRSTLIGYAEGDSYFTPPGEPRCELFGERLVEMRDALDARPGYAPTRMIPVLLRPLDPERYDPDAVQCRIDSTLEWFPEAVPVDGIPLSDDLVHYGTDGVVQLGHRMAEYFVAQVFPCRADCDCDGFVASTDIVCYLNAFNAGGAYADFDGSGGVDSSDVLAFLNEFNSGCP